MFTENSDGNPLQRTSVMEEVREDDRIAASLEDVSCVINVERYATIGTQTEADMWPMTSSPQKNASTFLDSFQSEENSDFIPNSESFEKNEEPQETSNRMETDYMKDEKFVVFESMLDQLFTRVRCDKCFLPVSNVSRSKLGTSIHCKLYCPDKHLILDWKSQPLIGKLPLYNLLISAAIFFSGSTYETFRKPVSYTGLNFVNSNTFYNIQRTLVIPAVKEKFDICIKVAREEAKLSGADSKVILGDGRFDSPGKSAKYCTYTCQSASTKKIISTSTIQTSKGKGSAPLELQGFRNCLEDLESDSFDLSAVATDRNRQLVKWLRENRSAINHCFDPWHFSKNIKSNLRKLVKRKGCKIIQEWIKPIGNHLFWCADNCNGDTETLQQMWMSVLEHITNKHNFKKKFAKYPQCAHKPYSKAKSRRKKWIDRKSDAFVAIEKVVLDKKNLKDMAHLTKPYHTGSLEVFHSLLNSYASKRQEFELNVMDARVKLAVLDHNANINRKQSIVTKERKGSGKVGEKQWKFVSSRLSKEWVAKEKKEPKSIDFIHELVASVVARKKNGECTTTKAAKLQHRLKSPQNIAFTERPDKQIILEKHEKIKRFKK